MKANITTLKEKHTKFPNLFGAQTFKNVPLFLYAEQLFYNGMSQFIEGDSGGFFEYIEIMEADVEIESDGFIPVQLSDKKVNMTNHYGTTATLTKKAASLVTWVFVVEQIAHNVTGELTEKLYNVIQDIKYSYARLTDKDGCKIFSDTDLAAIYRLLD